MEAKQPAKEASPAAGREVDGAPKRSFAQVLGKAMRDDLEDKPTDSTTFRKEGSPALRLSDSDVSRGESHVSNHVVVLKFSSFRPSLDSIRDSIHRFWGISGEFIMGLIDPRHVVVYLQSEVEVKKVLSKDSFLIRGVRYKIFRWHPGFSLRADPELAPLWIELPNLPFAFFLPAIMKAIGDSFGSFLRIDDGTRFFARPKVARMCVEIDVTKPLPHRIWLESSKYGGFWQKLEYPGFKYCDHCSLIGHKKDYCRKLVGEKKDQSTVDGKSHREIKDSDKTKQIQVGEIQGQNVYKQMYVPVATKTMENDEKIGVSGAKNSQGVEILSEQGEENKVKDWDKEFENVILVNKFGVLDEENSDGCGEGIEKTHEDFKMEKHISHMAHDDAVAVPESTAECLFEAGYTVSEIANTMGNQELTLKQDDVVNSRAKFAVSPKTEPQLQGVAATAQGASAHTPQGTPVPPVHVPQGVPQGVTVTSAITPHGASAHTPQCFSAHTTGCSSATAHTPQGTPVTLTKDGIESDSIIQDQTVANEEAMQGNSPKTPKEFVSTSMDNLTETKFEFGGMGFDIEGMESPLTYSKVKYFLKTLDDHENGIETNNATKGAIEKYGGDTVKQRFLQLKDLMEGHLTRLGQKNIGNEGWGTTSQLANGNTPRRSTRAKHANPKFRT